MLYKNIFNYELDDFAMVEANKPGCLRNQNPSRELGY
jgi:hypothetical protein